MGLRPRTARRLALAGAIVFLLVLGLAVAFTLPKFQNRRQLESFQRDGMLAHEQGRHGQAVQMLGRHLRGMGDRPVQPETRLAFARSRAELEVSDGGHIPAAIAVYRLYLQDRAEDREASIELLDLFMRSGQWVEARELSGRLRASDLGAATAADLPVLRQEAIARVAINEQDPVIPQIEDRLLAAEPPAFVDVWRAYTRAIARGDLARADGIVERYRSADPDSLGRRVVEAVVGSDGLPFAEAARALGEVIGIDPETGASVADIPLTDDELSKVLVLLVGGWRQEPMLLTILDRAASTSTDPEFARLLARRRYWAGQRADLLAQSAATPDGRVVADVLGYAAMVHLDAGEAEQVGAVLERLTSMTDDFRARGWLQAVQARQQAEAGQLVDARATASKAVETYPFEPTLRFVLGDVHDRMGRLADASDAWDMASELAGRGVWTLPEVRSILALLRAGRVSEAGSAARELVSTVQSSGNARTLVEAWIIQLQVDAQLAVAAQLDREAAERSMQIARALVDGVSGPLRADCMLHLVAFEAATGSPDKAREELAAALAMDLSPTQRSRAEELDLAFGLGVFAAPSEITLDPFPDRPDEAIRASVLYVSAAGSDVDRSERLNEAVAALGGRIREAGPDDRTAWLRADALVKDQLGHAGAADAWRAVLAAAPSDLDLITQAIESEALVNDREFVESSIARIIELTATQGRTLPSRIRLARARSIFGRTPTRQSRDEALLIVRSVVVAEPQNVAARTLLGNMLRVPCPPEVPAADRFEPDLAGAVEQYLAASRLVGGRAAMGYLFEAAGLSYAAGNEAETRRILADLVAQTRVTPTARGALARDLARFGDAQTSTRMIEQMFETSAASERAELGLLLAQLYLGSNENARAARVLDSLIAARPALTRSQLVDVVARYTQAGQPDRAEAVLGDVTRFGLQAGDAARIRAERAIRGGDFRAAIDLLTTLVEREPQDPALWITLIDALVRSGDTDSARSRVEEALAAHPGNPDLVFWSQMTSGDLAGAVLTRASEGAELQSVRLAIERVQSYEDRKGAMQRDARLAELRDLRAAFPGNAPVLKYVFRERVELGEDPAVLARDTVADHRRFVEDEELLRFAALAALRGGLWEDAMRLATRLRGQTRGSTLEADLIFAQAAQVVGNHAGVVDRLSTAIDAAMSSPDSPQSRQVLFLYGGSSILSGSESSFRSRLEPVARAQPLVRADVWIPLAAGTVSPGPRAEAWMRAAEDMGLEGMEVRAADAWMAMADRFPEQSAAFADSAARIALGRLAGNPDDVEAVAVAAVATQRKAETAAQADADELFAQAAEFYLRASLLQPGNPNFLFTAAICADAAGRSAAAEQHYRDLLGRFPATDLFGAAIRNNLAGVLTRENPTSTRLAEALELANQAVGFQEIPAFYGTRGWVHLARKSHRDAEADFQRVTQLDPASAEGWLGLAAVLKDVEGEPSRWQPPLQRARQVAGSAGLSRELQVKAAMYGLLE